MANLYDGRVIGVVWHAIMTRNWFVIAQLYEIEHHM